MALQTNKTWNGITVQDAYLKIISYSGNKNTMSFALGCFASSSEEKMFSQEKHQCAVDLDGDNAVKQAYEYLKTLPEFSSATDV